jgi:uncharacterized protein (TIGR02001 family)
MTMYKPLTIILFISALLLANPQTSHAEVEPDRPFTGNITATSTYLWRGLALTENAAVQGGINYQAPFGLHTQLWTSTVDFGANGGSEIDLTIGFANQVGSFHYDAGLVFYFFPQHDGKDFEELYVAGRMGAFGAKISLSDDEGEYYEGDVTLPISQWQMQLRGGFYRRKNELDYSDIGLTFSRDLAIFKVAFTISDTDLSNDDLRTVVSLAKDFIP